LTRVGAVVNINKGGAHKAIAGALIAIVCLVVVYFTIVRGRRIELPPGWNTSSGALWTKLDNKGIPYTATYPGGWVMMTMGELGGFIIPSFADSAAGFRSPASDAYFIFFPTPWDNRDLSQLIDNYRELERLLGKWLGIFDIMPSAILLEDKDIMVNGRPGHQFVATFSDSFSGTKAKVVLFVADKTVGPYHRWGFVLLCVASSENLYQGYSNVFDTMINQLRIN